MLQQISLNNNYFIHQVRKDIITTTTTTTTITTNLGIFLFATASRTAPEPTRPPIQWVTGALSIGVKRPEREAAHSPPSNAEFKE
jgi:hypothetical protein